MYTATLLQFCCGTCGLNGRRLTSNHHHADREHLFVVGLGCDIAEANAGHAGHREVERRDVHCRTLGPAIELDPGGDIVRPQVEWQLDKSKKKDV